MSEIKNGRLGLHGTEHSKCDRMMRLGFKELTLWVGPTSGARLRPQFPKAFVIPKTKHFW